MEVKKFLKDWGASIAALGLAGLTIFGLKNTFQNHTSEPVGMERADGNVLPNRDALMLDMAFEGAVSESLKRIFPEKMAALNGTEAAEAGIRFALPDNVYKDLLDVFAKTYNHPKGITPQEVEEDLVLAMLKAMEPHKAEIGKVLDDLATELPKAVPPKSFRDGVRPDGPKNPGQGIEDFGESNRGRAL